MQVKGRAAFITGGAQGLGKAIGCALLSKGAKVCLADVNIDQGEATLKELQNKYGHGNVIFAKCDVTSQTDMEEAVRKTKEAFGGLHIFCNNAGIGGEVAPLWEKTVDINVKGVIRGTMLALDNLRTDKGGDGGVIINMSSGAGLLAYHLGPVYCTTKAAVIAHTRAWAAHPDVHKAGVRLNVLCPAFADTAMLHGLNDDSCTDLATAKMVIEKAGLMTPDEVAEAFMELVEDESRHGAVLRVSKAEGKQYCTLTHSTS